MFKPLLTRVVGVSLGLLLSVVLSRYISKDEVGEFLWCMSLVQFVSIYLKRGLDIYFLKNSKDIVSEAILKSIVAYNIKWIVANASIATLISLAIIFQSRDDLYYIVLALIAAPLISFSQLVTEAARGKGEQVTTTASQTWLIPMSVIATTILGNNPYIGLYISAVAGVFLSIIILKKTDDQNTKKNQIIINSAEQSNFFVISILGMLTSNIDVIVAGLLLDNKGLADYIIATRIAAVGAIVLTVVNGYYGPRIASLKREKKEFEIRNEFIKTIKHTVFISLLMYSTMALFAEFCIIKLYGVEYTTMLKELYILMIGYSFALATGPIAYTLMMSGHEASQKIITLISLLACIVTLALFNPDITGIQIAISFTTMQFAKNCIGYIYIANKTQFLVRKR